MTVILDFRDLPTLDSYRTSLVKGVFLWLPLVHYLPALILLMETSHSCLRNKFYDFLSYPRPKNPQTQLSILAVSGGRRIQRI